MRTTSVNQPYMTPRNRVNPWFVRIPLLTVTGVIILVLLLGMSFAAFQAQIQERIVPGVYALGVNLSGMSLDEARDAVAGQFDYADSAVFTFRHEDQVWQLTAADLGVELDVDAVLNAAYAIGHDTNPVNGVMQQAQAWFNGVNIPPTVTYDEGIAAARLREIAAEIDQPAANAELMIGDGEVTTTPARSGRLVDINATLQALSQAIMQMNTGAEVGFVIQEIAPVITNADDAAQQIAVALSGPLRLVASTVEGDPLGPWTATPEQIRNLLQINVETVADNTQAYTVSVDMTAFESFLETLAPGLIASPRNARFDFDEMTGQLTVIEPSVSGRTLNVSETVRRLEEAVFNAESRVVPVAFDMTLPPLHNQVTAAELGIRELVAESTTYFSGSTQNRRTNIAVSASKFNGVVLAPGEEFSFNTLLGEISEANGFVEGKVIFGGRTVDGIGGGVCQVSTTVFRAAFEGGFAITERNSHGYRVGYYELNGQPPGMDAAIWQPERDFRFQNNTPHHLLIETSIFPETNALQFRFYSTKHWDAVIEQPIVKNLVPALPVTYEANSDLRPGDILQVDYAAEGADVTVYREIYDMNGEFVREDYEYTHYLPWGAIYQVSPGDSRLRSS